MYAIRKWRVQEFRDLMVELVKLMEPELYVEIGIQHGYTFNTISKLVPRAVGVDIEIKPNVKKGPGVVLFEADSLSVAASWDLGTIDLLFIDGDHRKEAVLADVDAWSPYVRDFTGIILLHDTYPVKSDLLSDSYCSNAWEAAWEIRTNPRYDYLEIFTIPGPWAGLSLLRKAPRHLGWKD